MVNVIGDGTKITVDDLFLSVFVEQGLKQTGSRNR